MDKKVESIKIKKVKGRISTIQVYPYKGIIIYLRKINEDIVEYLLSFKGELFSQYFIITPSAGRTSLTKKQLVEVAGYVFQAAVTTVDYLLDPKAKKDREKEAQVRYNELVKRKEPNNHAISK